MDDAALRQRAIEAASTVVDPEIPVLTIADLGVLRDVVVDGGRVRVDITPTYSGCPAMNMIAVEIDLALARAGIDGAEVRTVLSPAWTTDWMTDDGRRILLDRGFVDQDHKRDPRPPVRLDVVGNLHWPQEKGSATPAPNLDQNIWFARDVPAMAKALGTEPVLVVAAEVRGDAQGVECCVIALRDIAALRRLERRGGDDGEAKPVGQRGVTAEVGQKRGQKIGKTRLSFDVALEIGRPAQPVTQQGQIARAAPPRH